MIRQIPSTVHVDVTKIPMCESSRTSP